MHPRIHAFLAMLFSYGLFTIGVPGFFCLGIALLGNTKLIPSFIVLISIFLLYYLIIRTLRVHCREPNCNGKMNINIHKDSIIEWKIKYNCEICDSVYEQYIFSINSGAYP
jgi:hypothetical protein